MPVGGVDWPTVLAAMHSWVVNGSGLSSQQVVWGQQDAPRPEFPGLTLRISNISDVGSSWLDTVPNPLVFADKTVSAVSAVNNTLTSTAHGLLTGDGPVHLTSTGTLPGGTPAFDDETNLWIVKVDDNTVKLATSFLDAMASTPTVVDLTSGGSGTIKIVDTPDSLRAGEELQAVARGLARVTLEIRCHADLVIGSNMAVAILQRIRTRRLWPSQEAILETANISLQDVERVRAILGTRDDFLFEPRAYLDVYILIPIEEGEDLTIIDRVIATNQILDPDEDFEIPAPSVEAVSTPPVFDDPIAGFTFDVDDLDVDFTDTSTAPDGTVVSWLWDFGDSGTSTLQNPSHTYASAGTYTVTLTVTDSNGNTDDFQDDVTVIENLVIAGLIVIWGQSNGLGFGVASGMSNYPGIATPYPAVQMWERGAPSPGGGAPVWTTEGPRDLQPRGTTIGTQVAGTNGIELTLMRALDTASPGGWYVLKVNANSTGLEDEWKTATYLNQLKSDINARLAAWSTTVVGMVSVIGETDSSESPDAANTYANLNTIYDDLRADFGDFAIAQVRLNSNYRVGADVPTVRAGQEAFVSKNPKARIVEIDDFLLREAQPLATHYADNEYGVAGERAAAKLLDVLLEVPTPAHPRYMGQSKPAIIGAGSALTYTMPEYYEGEDILVAWVMGLGNTAYAAPSGGWAQFPDSPLHDNADSLSARLQAFWMRVPGTVGTDQTGTVTAPVIADVAGDDQKFGAIMVLRGCASSGNPYDVTAGDTATTSTSISIPGDTTTVNNCLVIGMVAHKVDQLFAQVSGWAASGLTELTEQVDEDRNNTNGYGFAAVTGVITTAGSYGPITATLASTATQARMSIAFKP